MSLLLHEKDCPLVVRFQASAFLEILKQSRRVDSLSAYLFKGQISLFPELSLVIALPSTLDQIYERVHISEKNPGSSPL